jgi:hypothetical protein
MSKDDVALNGLKVLVYGSFYVPLFLLGLLFAESALRLTPQTEDLIFQIFGICVVVAMALSFYTVWSVARRDDLDQKWLWILRIILFPHKYVPRYYFGDEFREDKNGPDAP